MGEGKRMLVHQRFAPRAVHEWIWGRMHERIDANQIRAQSLALTCRIIIQSPLAICFLLLLLRNDLIQSRAKAKCLHTRNRNQAHTAEAAAAAAIATEKLFDSMGQ